MDDAGPSGSSGTIVTRAVACFQRMFRGKEDAEVIEEEIKSMVSEGQEQGVIQGLEADMISNILDFWDKDAQDIMTNRNQMICVDGNLSLSEAAQFMLAENNSRFPVYAENIDQIVGILHLRDAIGALSYFATKEDQEKAREKEAQPIRKYKEILRKPMYVPETKSIDDLLRAMQDSKTQMAIVLDEYGQTAGLVTIEDIIEEIVGNILDEYDEDEGYIEETAHKDEFLIEGKTPLEELEEKLDISFENQEVETLNGLVIARMEHVPEDGEYFEFDEGGYHFRVMSVSDHMVQSVLVTKTG